VNESRKPSAPVASPAEAAGFTLPQPYRIMPEAVPFNVPGFLRQRWPTDRVLAPAPVGCDAWFSRFAARVAAAVGTTHLPVCRMSDGEFLLLFGHQPPSLRYPWPRRLRIGLRQAASRIAQQVKGFRAQTAPGVSSGAMSLAERRAILPELSRRYAALAEDGILALHLSYGGAPFQEHYFPALGRWLRERSIRLTTDNYVPFYFVYGLLRGPEFPRLVAGRRVLVVHSAGGEKRERIMGSIRGAGAGEVEWLAISPTRSFAEDLDLSRLRGKPEICLLGAGVGKGMLFEQLRPLGIPCIDAGFCFEVWADPAKQWDRPYMTPDDEFDVARVRFLDAAGRAALAAVTGQPSPAAAAADVPIPPR
jgi:hypothetical protein